MKFKAIMLVLISIIVISFIECKKKNVAAKLKKGKSKNNKKWPNNSVPAFPVSNQDQSGNFYEYGYATNDMSLQNQAGFKNAELMEKIPEYLNTKYAGKIEEASTYFNNKLYYDGRNNLNAIHIECSKLNNDPHKCTGNSQCGWCQGDNHCVPGSQTGPITPCLRGSFLYTSPTEKWNPLHAGDYNIRAINQKRQPTLHLTHEPELSNVYVHKPYA